MSISTSSKYDSSTGICAGTLSELINDGVITFSGDGTSGNLAPSSSGNSVTVTLGTGDAVSDNHFYIKVQENSYNSLYLYKIRTKADWSITDHKAGLFGVGSTLAHIRQGNNITSGDHDNLASCLGSGSGDISYSSTPSVNDWSTAPNFQIGIVDIGAGNKTLTLSNLAFELHYGLQVSWEQKLNGTLSVGSASSNNGYTSSANNIASKNICAVDKYIKLTAKPAIGYEVDKWWDGQTETNADYTVNREVKVTKDNNPKFYVTFKPHTYKHTYQLKFIDKTINADGTETYTALSNSHSSVKFDNNTDFNNATTYLGGTANFSLKNPKDIYGYKFLGWLDVTDGTKTAEETAKGAGSITIKPSTDPKDRVFQAVYELVHFDVNYSYRDNYGETDYDISVWNDILQNQKTYTVRDSKTKFSAKPNRDGYRFVGYQVTNENGPYLGDENTPNGLPPEGTGNVNLILVFAYFHLNVIVKPVLINGEIDRYMDWWNKNGAEHRPRVTVTNMETKETGETIEVNYVDGFNRLKLHVISEEDDDTFTGKYNPRVFEFLGWRRQYDQLSMSNSPSHIVSSVVLHHDDRFNVYEAVFKLIDYNINIQMYDQNGEERICGEVLTSKGSADHIAYTTDGMAKISGLVFGEERDITIIPYALDSTHNYFLDKWDSKNSNAIFNAKIDEALSGNTLDKTIQFSLKNLGENGVNSKNDKLKVIELFDKSIREFIMADGSKVLSKLGDRGFYNCNNLQYVYMPTCAEIGDNTFENCKNLKNIVISSSSVDDPSIGTNTFLNCKNLTSIILPYNFMYLGSIFSPWDIDPPEIPDIGYTIESYQSLFRKGLGRIYVPKTLQDKYKGSDQWGIYADVICAIEDNPEVYKGNYLGKEGAI